MIQPRSSSPTARAPRGAVLGALLAIGISACTTLSTSGPSVERAEAAARSGDYAVAAGMYEALAAAATGEAAARLRLRAAEEWNIAGQVGEVQRVLALILAPLPGDEETRRLLLDADVSAQAGEAQLAWQKISALAVPSPPMQPAYYALTMRLALGVARPVEAVNAHINATAALTEAQALRAARSELLSLLRGARERGVKLEPAASPDPIVRGWLDLGALASAQRGVSLSGGADATRWRARYPGHPATELLAEALPAQLGAAPQLQKVALLLPLSGRAAAAANTVREGFQHALNQLPAGRAPELALYDTGVIGVGDALAQARATGADFIVGPLTREELQFAAAAEQPGAPLLALNFLPNGQAAPSNWYQYALAPEDEARQIARRLLAEGRKQGAVLTPNNDWGVRVLQAFTQELAAGGGVVLTQASFEPNAADYGGAIRMALGTEQSEARRRQLQTVLGGRLEFEPRRRADLQFVFAATPSATSARLMRPQLRFHYAGDLPIYATADAYAPSTGDANNDLEGLVITDMPWMIPTEPSVAEVRQSAERTAVDASWRSRLFAFGYDALQLAIALSSAGGVTDGLLVAGLSGQLSVDADGRVRRGLRFAQLKRGELQLLPDAGGT